jgi:hypothetical protein
MGKKYQIFTATIIGLFLIAFFLSIYITVEEKIPPNAVVVTTSEDKLYHSIHFDYICLAQKTAETMTLQQATTKGYRPDPHCESLNYFRGNRRFLFYHLLSTLGLQVNSRWDKYGNWLW